MSLGRPTSEFRQHTCPKCGAVQESPGSTVCEQCGTDLKLAVARAPSQRPIAPLKQPPRFGQLLGVPARFVTGVFGALLSFVSSVLSFIWRLISLALRTAVVLLVIGALVVGLSYVPQVRARVPAIKDAPKIAKQGLLRAGVMGIRMLASLARARKESQPEKRTSSERRTPQQRTSHPAVTAQKPAPAKVAVSQPFTIKSTPTGATVRVNGLQVGKTPLYLSVAPGTYNLLVSRPGYTSITRTITVKAGKATSLDLKLLAVRRTPRRTVPTPTHPPEGPRVRKP